MDGEIPEVAQRLKQLDGHADELGNQDSQRANAASAELEGYTDGPAIPEPYRDDPLLKDAPFFTLPKELLNMAFDELGDEAFEVDVFEMEAALSDKCGDHSAKVGFWQDREISFSLLRQAQLLVPLASEIPGCELNELQLKHVWKKADAALSHFRLVARGYAGWLLTCREFLQEHDELVNGWLEEVQCCGLPALEPIVPPGTSDRGWLESKSPRREELANEFEEFYVRWRLDRLAAPRLPVPLTPLWAGQFSGSVVNKLSRAGGVFYMPDTFPVPSRDDLRHLLDQCLFGSEVPEHMAEWREIIGSDNTNKQRNIAKYARLFELQHYWRIFHDRHRSALNRKLGRLERCLAGFLGTEHGTIHSDLLFISSRLGPDWAGQRSV